MITLLIICLNAACTSPAGGILLIVSLIFYILARDSLLKHLYILQFLGRLLASLLCVFKNGIKTPSYSM